MTDDVTIAELSGLREIIIDLIDSGIGTEQIRRVVTAALDQDRTVPPLPRGRGRDHVPGLHERPDSVTPYVTGEEPADWLTTAEAAYHIGTGAKQVRDLLRRGDLLGVPVLTGTDEVPLRYIVHPQSVADFIAWREAIHQEDR